jgi:hypothetical protein
MKVLVVFQFDEVSADSAEAESIVSQVSESCEFMQVGFDASGCWVQECFDDDARDVVAQPAVVHKIG